MMRKGTRRGSPLRRVVDWRLNQYGSPVDILECGHEMIRRQDHYGYYAADRRRCGKCRILRGEGKS